MKNKLLLILLAAASVFVVSCNKDETVKYGEQMVLLENPEALPKVKGTLKCAGYFHDEDSQGYHFVFLSDRKTISGEIEEEPKGAWFTIDLPEGKTNGTYDLKESLDAEHWAFYCNANGDYYFEDGGFKEGTIKIALDENKGTIDFKMDATYLDNTRIHVQYKGKIAKVDSYIEHWIGV